MKEVEIDYPDDVRDILLRLVRVFPMDEAMRAEFRPGDYNTRFSAHIGKFDITYDHEELVELVRMIRVTVWEGCGTLMALDVFPHSMEIRKIHYWQDQKVREQLIPLINQKLVLDDLSEV